MITMEKESGNMLKKDQQGKYLRTLVIICSIASFAVGGYYLTQAMMNQNDNNVVEKEKNDKYFKIRTNATGYQRSVYTELNDVLANNKDDEKQVAELITKNFVADFYTWTNKFHFNDVGGLQFVDKTIAPSVMNQALQYFYNDMAYYLNENKVAKTLEVSGATTRVSTVEYVLQRQIIGQSGRETQAEIKKPGYEVTVNWSYKEQDGFDTSKYQRQGSVILVKDDEGVLRIMEVSHD